MTRLKLPRRLEISEGPHVLFVGGNGFKTVGITFRTLEPKERVEDIGYARTWRANLPWLQRFPEVLMEALDEDQAACDKVLAELIALEISSNLSPKED